jgi:hypothetical protein
VRLEAAAGALVVANDTYVHMVTITNRITTCCFSPANTICTPLVLSEISLQVRSGQAHADVSQEEV